MDSDTFTFKVEPKHKPFTLRGILSVTSSVYDSLGLVSPVIVPAKKLLQDLCQQKIGWDNKIALEELARWRSWISDLPKLSQVAIQRNLKPSDFSEVRSSSTSLCRCISSCLWSSCISEIRECKSSGPLQLSHRKITPSSRETHDNTEAGTVSCCSCSKN